MLNFTSKTYYAFGILGVASSMAQAFFVVSGQGEAGVLGNIALLVVGLMFCLLASIKGTEMRRKKQLVLCALLLILSSVQIAPLVNYLLLAAAWPYFAFIEQDGSDALRRPMQAIIAIEAVCFVLRLLVALGGMTALSIAANGCWLVATITRGWLLVACYKREARKM